MDFNFQNDDGADREKNLSMSFHNSREKKHPHFPTRYTM